MTRRYTNPRLPLLYLYLEAQVFGLYRGLGYVSLTPTLAINM